ncbi:MAG: hypothetical protein MUF78_10000 [Candidatus Edwardsbacteria bacterium]|nr:hypothetical protein [Candidatus Edwardsbacteria bacterium]
MKKLAIALLAAALAAPSLAQEESNFKVTPPPISCLDFHKGNNQFTFTGIYMKLGQAEDATGDAPTGWGFNAEMTRGFGEGFGVMYHFMFLGMNMPMDAPNDDIPVRVIGLGPMVVVDLKKGEKRDIAGEIIEKKATVAAFTGLDLLGTFMSMDYASGGEISVSSSEICLPLGMAADFPLGPMVSLVPFGRFSWIANTVTYDYDIAGYSGGGTSDTSYTRFDYGMDIDLRLFRNAPEWKISVGTVLSQVQGMADGNLLIMASVKREWGKHYSSTMFGPVLH